MASLSADLQELSESNANSAIKASQRGDEIAAAYLRGRRDAYALAATLIDRSKTEATS